MPMVHNSHPSDASAREISPPSQSHVTCTYGRKTLPPELYSKIFEELDYQSLLTCAQVAGFHLVNFMPLLSSKPPRTDLFALQGFN